MGVFPCQIEPDVKRVLLQETQTELLEVVASFRFDAIGADDGSRVIGEGVAAPDART